MTEAAVRSAPERDTAPGLEPGDTAASPVRLSPEDAANAARYFEADDLAAAAADPQSQVRPIYALPDIFNDSAAPPGVDFTADQLAIAQQTNRSYGLLTIGAGAGAMYTEDREEEQERRDEEIFDWLRERAEEQRAEFIRQWDESMHTIGGMQFRGADLHNMYLASRKQENIDAFEDELMQSEGISREEAKKRSTRLKRALELKERERMGELTPDERRELDRIIVEPGIAEDLTHFDTIAKAGRKVSFENDKKNTAVTAPKLSEFSLGKADADIQKREVEAALRLLEKERLGNLGQSEKRILNVYLQDEKIIEGIQAYKEPLSQERLINTNIKLTSDYNKAADRVAQLSTDPTPQKKLEVPTVQIAGLGFD